MAHKLDRSAGSLLITERLKYCDRGKTFSPLVKGILAPEIYLRAFFSIFHIKYLCAMLSLKPISNKWDEFYVLLG